MTRGNYIVIDGLDGSGKGGVIDSLKLAYPHVSAYDSIHSTSPIRVVYTREPGGTELGEQLRSLLLRVPMDPVTEFFLFLAQRKEARNAIAQNLEKGISVISDRSDSSTYAFQLCGRNLPELKDIFVASMKFLFPSPDLYIILDLPASVAQGRTQKRFDEGGQRDRIDNEGLLFHERVRSGFQEFRTIVETPCVFVDATKNKEEVTADVLALVTEVFKR